MNKLGAFCLLFYLSLISTQVPANTFRYSGKCQFTFSRVKYASCLEKELVSYDEIFKKMYTNLTPNQSLKINQALATQILEPDCDALAKQSGEDLEYHIIYRTCLLQSVKARIACIKSVTSCHNCLGNKLMNMLNKPALFIDDLSINFSDQSR